MQIGDVAGCGADQIRLRGGCILKVFDAQHSNICTPVQRQRGAQPSRIDCSNDQRGHVVVAQDFQHSQIAGRILFLAQRGHRGRDQTGQQTAKEPWYKRRLILDGQQYRIAALRVARQIAATQRLAASSPA